MKRSPKPKWSFVLMRGADKSVRQFKVSKRSIVAAPAVAVLALSGCIAALQIRSAFQIDTLQDEMSQQSNSFTQTVHGKDDSIGTLQEEIDRLNRQTEDLKSKISDLRELENKLKVFIEQYGRLTETSSSSMPTNADSATLEALSELQQSSSSPTPEEARRLIGIAEQSGLDFRQISSLVDSMESTMEQSVKQAKARKAILDALPTGWPTKSSSKMTSGFGYRSDPFTGKSTFHAGIDIGGKVGDPVFSAGDGTVVETGSSSDKGNYVMIDHHNGFKTVYMHLSRIEAREDEEVVRGEKIGFMGSTGRSTGAHVHFQIMQKDEPINPLRYLS
ncbi:murein DD-endopeptidase MepM/ murein hydrolase activator NlpD [Paenibacillus cellulosilyticus]|uniref:Murein DD-endopeptidase MepM/ murein hydrolase activator NlpD n=1 Tax=Paenibacillus cellulosilyticus TaxID=375489 RepID=A0A2V2YNA4_9BACL|nr:M23 family metallopeptidase [Paenibacillus cellulosilyticus]PWV93789.1 murein DD-endopeptidase MepM/ murein hydrolase activator NlpD [Paenibacillus cellulosilyticus]QKS47406.1 peptidoglycan DD-metalloendopeptidase family protein [Paenibacillus cellulosilyticus]